MERLYGEVVETRDTDLEFSDYSYSPVMPSSATGFSFSQTGPLADPVGSAWDTTTVEGSQNFFANQGDSEEYPFPLSPYTGGDAVDFQTFWMPTAPAVGHGQTHKAEPMRRSSSKASASSHRNTGSASSRSQTRIQASVSQRAHQGTSFDMTGNASTYTDGLPGSARAMDSTQYLIEQVQMPYNGMVGHPLSTLNLNGFATAQHVDPSALPLNFETSVSGGSPTETWDNFSEVATPRDDSWLLMQSSPITSVSSNSPSIPVMDNFSLVSPVVQPMVASMPTVPVDDQIQLNDWAGAQQGAEGESARDHPYYKNAFLHPDGLYHCPWEGQAGCCHKPEKLKCNYDKFVDSHLKPYRCKMESCKELPFSSTACLLRHEREAHGMHGHGTKPYPCTFKGCDRAQPGNGFPRKWNLQDHMQRVHNASPPSPDEDGRKDALKSRKRKSDSSSKLASSRKSPKTRKASPRMEPQEPAKIDVPAKLRRDWSSVHANFQTALPGLDRLDDPTVLMHINRLKDSLDALGKIHVDYMAAVEGTNMQQLQNLAHLQHAE